MSPPADEEHRTAFFGEDIHIDIPEDLGEVVFKSRQNASSEVFLLQAGKVMTPRCHLNSLGHLVVEDVQEEDEGLYVIKSLSNPNAVKHLFLIVRGKVEKELESISQFEVACLLISGF